MTGELAFEEFTEEAPPVLWRLVSDRPHIMQEKRPIRHVKWFVTESAAREHAAWIEDGRGKVLQLARYERKDAQPSAG